MKSEEIKEKRKIDVEELFKDIELGMENGFQGPPHAFADVVMRKGGVVSKKLRNMFKPGEVDNQLFWKNIHENFGTLAVTNLEGQSIEQANAATLRIAEGLGLLERVESQLNSDIKILEIGSGYGNFHDWLKLKSFDMNNYYSIDVYPYFFHDNMFVTDGDTFPDKLPKFDIIYSCNVFQHLTQKQRNMYYDNISEHLTNGGIFLGGNMMKHPDNKYSMVDDKSIWQIKDDEGNDYVSFFGQYTEVEDAIDFFNRMKVRGLTTQFITGTHNFLTYQSKKTNYSI